MFKQGLKHGVYVILITLISIAFTFLLDDKKYNEIIIGVTLIVSWLVVGYYFKKQYGSLFSIAIDPLKVKGIGYYILGVGLIWGPAKLLATDLPMENINPIIYFMLIVLSVPFAGMSAIGALVVGGMFHRDKA